MAVSLQKRPASFICSDSEAVPRIVVGPAFGPPVTDCLSRSWDLVMPLASKPLRVSLYKMGTWSYLQNPQLSLRESLNQKIVFLPTPSACSLVRYWKPGSLGFQLREYLTAEAPARCLKFSEGKACAQQGALCLDVERPRSIGYAFFLVAGWCFVATGPWKGPQRLVLRTQWACLGTVPCSKGCVQPGEGSRCRMTVFCCHPGFKRPIKYSFQCGCSYSSVQYFCWRCYTRWKKPV